MVSMNWLHSRNTFITRSGDRSMAAATAYATGDELTDPNRGTIHDFSRKSGVETRGMIVPPGGEGWENAQAMIDAAERFEDWRADQRFASSTRKAEAFLAANPGYRLEGEVGALPSDFASLDQKQKAEAIKALQKEWRASSAGKELSKNGFDFRFEVDESNGVKVVNWKASTPAELQKRNASVGMSSSFSLWNGFDAEQRKEVVERFIKERYTDNQLAAIYGIHPDEGNSHFHIVAPTRTIKPDGSFGPKPPFFEKMGALKEWTQGNRETLARIQMEVAAENGMELRIDHRSFKEQGIEFEATQHEGYAANQARKDGAPLDVLERNNSIRALNAIKAFEDAEAVIDVVARQRSAFTETDLSRELFKRLEGDEALFTAAKERLIASKKLVHLGQDVNGREVYTTTRNQTIEADAFSSAEALEGQSNHRINHTRLEASLARSKKEGGYNFLSDEQKEAVRVIVSDSDLAIVKGAAGVGKTTLVQAAAREFEASGYRVRGMALANNAARTLGQEAGIKSDSVDSYIKSMETLDEIERTLKFGVKSNAEKRRLEAAKRSLEARKLTKKDVLILDEAGMLGTEKMGRLLADARAVGAKIVMLGDDRQLQAIEAGRIFEGLLNERHSARVFTIMRQSLDESDPDKEWMRKASMNFESGNTREALDAYRSRGKVALVEDADLIDHTVQRYFALRDANPDRTRTILAFQNKTVTAINDAVRAELVRRGEVGEGVKFKSASYGVGDRIVFLENDKRGEFAKSIGGANGATDGVLNGTQARVLTVERSGKAGVKIRAEIVGEGPEGTKPRIVEFDTNDFKKRQGTGEVFQHAYALTVHKSQGQTVHEALVVADKFYTQDAAYVAMTRHKLHAEMIASKADFAEYNDLIRAMSRAPEKTLIRDFTLNTDAQREADAMVRQYRDVAHNAGSMYASIEMRTERRVMAGEEDAIVFDDKQWGIYKQMAEDRKALALGLAEQFKEYDQLKKLSARSMTDEQRRSWDKASTAVNLMTQARIRREDIEVAAGLRERPASELEKEALERMKAYQKTSDEARSLWNEIKKTHPGARSKDHPEFARFDALRLKRDEAAHVIVSDEKMRPLHRRQAKAAGANWKTVLNQASTHLKRTSVTPEEVYRLEIVAEYKQARRDAADAWGEMVPGRKLKPGEQAPVDHPRYNDYQKSREVRDRLSIELTENIEEYAQALAAERVKPEALTADYQVAKQLKNREEAKRSEQETTATRTAQEKPATAQERPSSAHGAEQRVAAPKATVPPEIAVQEWQVAQRQVLDAASRADYDADAKKALPALRSGQNKAAAQVYESGGLNLLAKADQKRVVEQAIASGDLKPEVVVSVQRTFGISQQRQA